MLRRGARARAGLRILRVLCLLRPLRLRDPGMKAVIETLPFFRSVLDLKCDELCMQVDVSPQHTVLHTLHTQWSPHTPFSNSTALVCRVAAARHLSIS